MKKIFFFFLISIISLTIFSCANSKEDTSGALTQMDQVLDQPNSKDDEVNPNIPIVEIGTCYLLDNSNIDNSTVDNSTITDNSSIKNSTVKNCSTVTRSTVDNSSTIDNSSISDTTVNRSSICVQSIIDNSTIDNATVCNSSTVQGGSTVYNSTVNGGSTIQGGSTVRNSSTVCNSTVDNVTIDNATVCNSTVTNRTIQNITMSESVAPTVSGGVTISGASGVQNSLLNAGDVVSVTATFSENVSVAGTPQLTLVVGGTDRTATYTSGSGGTTLVFTYTIQAGETDTDGISIGADALALNSGTISDASGNNATLAHSSVANNSSYMVDTTAPTLTVSSVSLSADTGTSSTDEITKTASQTISGTLSGALASGDILYGSVNNGSSWTDITSKVSSDTAISWDGATLSGSNNIVFKITDGNGNDSNTTGSTAYVLDTTAPTLVITMSDYDMDDGKDTAPYNSTITFTFSEATSDSVFTAADITTPNGGIGSTLDGSGSLYTATFTPTCCGGASGVYDTTNVVTVGQAWTDLAGNAPAADSTSGNYIVDL